MDSKQLRAWIEQGQPVSGVDLSQVALAGADLSGGIFEKVSFRGADLSGADLRSPRSRAVTSLEPGWVASR